MHARCRPHACNIIHFCSMHHNSLHSMNIGSQSIWKVCLVKVAHYKPVMQSVNGLQQERIGTGARSYALLPSTCRLLACLSALANSAIYCTTAIYSYFATAIPHTLYVQFTTVLEVLLNGSRCARKRYHGFSHVIARGFRGITIVFYSPCCKVLHHPNKDSSAIKDPRISEYIIYLFINYFYYYYYYFFYGVCISHLLTRVSSCAGVYFDFYSLK